jgi:hypothetical protein
MEDFVREPTMLPISWQANECIQYYYCPGYNNGDSVGLLYHAY